MKNELVDQILNEQDIIAKMEIVYVLSNTYHLTFDKSCVLKTILAKLFVECMDITKVDQNMVLTAQMLANCKKGDNPQINGRIKTFAIESANFLYLIGFDQKFCTLVEQVNRYSETEPRYLESDVLELCDQCGGLLIDRSERIGFLPDEALVLLEYRNLKNYENKYKNLFKVFVEQIERIDTSDYFDYSILNQLVHLCRNSKNTKEYIQLISKDFINQADELTKNLKEACKKAKFDSHDSKRCMFNQDIVLKYVTENEETQNNKETKDKKEVSKTN